MVHSIAKVGMMATMRTLRKVRRMSCATLSDTSKQSKHVDNLRKLLGFDGILSGPEDTEGFTTDWTRQYKPDLTTAVALPKSTSDVQSVVKYCNKNGLTLIPQGGNTGLVGGAVGLIDPAGNRSRPCEVIMSLRRMNRVLKVDPDDSVVVCESGCILQVLNDHLENIGFMLPIDLGSRGQCQIGGNIATNAGGLNVVRYGPLSGHVLGLEVVTGDGRVLNMLRTLRKDNMGLHTPQIFIGSEGILGVITKVSMGLVPIPQYSQVLLCKLRGFDGVIGPALRLAKSVLGETLSAFEFMDSNSVEAVRRAMPELIPLHLKPLLPQPCASPGIGGEILLLLECSSSADLGQRLYDYLLAIGSHSPSLLVEGGEDSALVSQSKQQHKAFWRIRENVPVALQRLARGGGALYKHDISLPLSGAAGMSAAVAEVKEKMEKDGFSVITSLISSDGERQMKDKGKDKDKEKMGLDLHFACFGHAGDGNLHLNILAEGSDMESDPQVMPNTKLSIDSAVAQSVICRQGSLSAEHGVGQQKTKYLPRVRSAEELQVMAEIKRIFDPNNVLQPGKIII